MHSDPVGIVGVGLVGGVIVDRLRGADFSMLGFDIATVDRSGLTLLASATEVFERCDIVILSLPDSSVSASVLGAAPLRRGQLIIDTTTGAPQDAESQAAALSAQGACYLEATIAGSSGLLARGEAPLFLGGEEQAIHDGEAVLDALAPRRFLVGPAGHGARFKLMFNLMLGLHRAVLAEALTFGRSQGIDPGTALEILRQTPAFSSVIDTKGDRMVERDYDNPQARLSQHLKDVRLILGASATTPLSETHLHLLERAQSLGFGQADTSAIIAAFREPED